MPGRILPGVLLGQDVEVDETALLGLMPRGPMQQPLKLSIGAGSIIRAFTVIYADRNWARGYRPGSGLSSGKATSSRRGPRSGLTRYWRGLAGSAAVCGSTHDVFSSR